MNSHLSLPVMAMLLVVAIVTGCASTAPPVPAPVTTVAESLLPATLAVTSSETPVSFPGALSLNTYASFGSGEMTGNATVTRYDIRPNYTWNAPSFNSPREQAESSGPLDIEHGYNEEKAREGNLFLFIRFRVMATGTKAVYAPSPQNIVVSIDGKLYNYSPVHSSDVTINGVLGTQYDYQIGKGGVVGYVEPGESNSAEGYLIYEIPEAFSPEKTYVVSNLDYRTRAVWKLG